MIRLSIIRKVENTGRFLEVNESQIDRLRVKLD